MNLSIDIGVRDAWLRIPLNAYDEEGNIIGPNLDYDKEREEAEGKSFVRISCTDTDANEIIRFESGDGTNIEHLTRSCWDGLGRAVVKRMATVQTVNPF